MRALALPVFVGVAVYGLIAWLVWLIAPTPVDVEGDRVYRSLLSAFWSIGLLQETGNFSHVSCGY